MTDYQFRANERHTVINGLSFFLNKDADNANIGLVGN